MNEYLGRLPSNKYNLVGTNLVLAEGVPYSLAKVSPEGLAIRIETLGLDVAEHQLALYNDALSSGVPVALEGVGETVQSMLAESQRRETLLMRLIETVGISEQRRSAVA